MLANGICKPEGRSRQEKQPLVPQMYSRREGIEKKRRLRKGIKDEEKIQRGGKDTHFPRGRELGWHGRSLKTDTRGRVERT